MPSPSGALTRATASAFVTLALSVVLFTYQRALDPLYGAGPSTVLLTPVFIPCLAAASALHPRGIRFSSATTLAALALSMAPNATYWMGVYTSRHAGPVWGPVMTHAMVLAPLAMLFGVLLQTAWDGNDGTNGSRRGGVWYPVRFARAVLQGLAAREVAVRVWPRLTVLQGVSDSDLYLFLAAGAWSICILTCSPYTLEVTAQNDTLKGTSKNVRTPRGRNHRPQGGLARTGRSHAWGRSWFAGGKAARGTAAVAFVGVWWQIVRVRLSNPVLPHPLREPYTHPAHPLQILSSTQSTTGLIVVGQTLPSPHVANVKGVVQVEDISSIRYLRASHSILGGVWMDDKVYELEGTPPLVDAHGTRLGDSVYAAFVLQEAARLVVDERAGDARVWGEALVIGLGTGISATAFMRHGMNTTIVEIDPAVYEAARTYFGLPDPGEGRVFLEDVRGWAARRRGEVGAGVETTHYDIVVHDCFSGGAVPKHLFTAEFWRDLRAVVRRDGVLVVNMAGIIRSKAFRLVLYTLEHSFGKCLAFHDRMTDLPLEQYDTEFVNMVLFCTQSKTPMAFRAPGKSDYLGSLLRQHVFERLPRNEIGLNDLRALQGDMDAETELLLTDAHNPLGDVQRGATQHHWTVMRQVLPDVHWETY